MGFKSAVKNKNEVDRKMLYALKHISKVYGVKPAEVHALRDITIDIPASKFIVVLGASGSGKSTLLNLLGGMDSPTSGSILFRGVDISIFSARKLTKFRRKEVGFIFQSYNLLSNLTVLENVIFATSMVGLTRADAKDALTAVGLADRLDYYPHQLSGGQQQRVSIARALAKRPQVLLCDEPTGALDFETGVQVLGELQRLQREHETSIIVITHNKDIAKMADMVITMRSGEITEVIYNENPAMASEVQW